MGFFCLVLFILYQINKSIHPNLPPPPHQTIVEPIKPVPIPTATHHIHRTHYKPSPTPIPKSKPTPSSKPKPNPSPIITSKSPIIIFIDEYNDCDIAPVACGIPVGNEVEVWSDKLPEVSKEEIPLWTVAPEADW